MLPKKLLTLVVFFNLTLFFCLQTSYALPSSALANLLEKILGSAPSVSQSETKDKKDCYGRQIDREEECPKTETPRPASPQKPKNQNNLGGLNLGSLFGGLGGLGGGNSSSNNSNTNTGLTPFQSTSFAPSAAPAAATAPPAKDTIVPTTNVKPDSKPEFVVKPLPSETKEQVASFAKGKNATAPTAPPTAEQKSETPKVLPPIVSETQPKTETKPKEAEPKTAAGISPITPPKIPEPKVEDKIKLLSNTIFMIDCNDFEKYDNKSQKNIYAGRSESSESVSTLPGSEQAGSFGSTNTNPQTCISKRNLKFTTFKNLTSNSKFVVAYDASKVTLSQKNKCAIFHGNSLINLNQVTGYTNGSCDSFLSKDVSDKIAEYAKKTGRIFLFNNNYQVKNI